MLVLAALCKTIVTNPKGRIRLIKVNALLNLTVAMKVGAQ